MRRLTIVLISGMLFGSEIIWQLYKMYRRGRHRGGKKCVDSRIRGVGSDSIAEVMFFSKDSAGCRTHVNSDTLCREPNCAGKYLRNLVNYLRLAGRSLDVCMYILTCEKLTDAIVSAHKRGVLVRVIMDRDMAHNDACKITRFHENGIAVRLQDPDVLMHHKFVVIDDDILITGSINWTMSAFFGNFENVLVTDRSSLVEPYVKEFENLWKKFQPVTNDRDWSREAGP